MKINSLTNKCFGNTVNERLQIGFDVEHFEKWTATKNIETALYKYVWTRCF